MKLENRIVQLLIENESVTVEGFGSFLAYPAKASIKEDDNCIIPPHILLSFDSNKTNSNGLLENYLVQQEHIDLSSANKIIEEQVTLWQSKLRDNKFLDLDKLGTFVIDEANNLEFKTENLSLEAIGFYGLPILKPTQLNSTVITNKEVVTPVVKSNKWSYFLAVASVIPIIVGGFFYFATPQPIQKFVDHQWSGLVLPAIKSTVPNLLNSSNEIEKVGIKEEIIHNLPTTIVNPLEFVQEGTSITLPTTTSVDSLGNSTMSKFEITVVEEKTLNDSEKEVKAIIRNSSLDNKNSTVSKTSEPVVKEADNKLNIEKNPLKYQVIAASLRRSEDAVRMQAFLEKEGFKKSQIIYVKGKYYYVTFESFNNLDQASKYLNNLHKQRPDAWIREHR